MRLSFPQRVIEYLQSSFSTDLSPACFAVDADLNLLETWGDARWCGLHDLPAQTPLLEKVPCLLGMLDKQPTTLEFVSMPDGSVAHVNVIPDSENFFVVLLNAKKDHDTLQEQQQAVNELKLLHASQTRLIGRQRDLIGELVEMRAELDHRRQAAEQNSTQKGKFIAMMSHEFRTPLASIINYAELATDDNIDTNTVNKCIEAVTRSAHHLNSLVEAILDDARLDAGNVAVNNEVFELHSLLQDLAEMMAPMAAEKELSFVSLVDDQLPNLIRADEIHLRQILINVLGNAIKFTKIGGIELAATYVNPKLIISVKDSGPGISVEDQERVFGAFQRGADESASGAGLGLAISLRLAKLMGGEITLDSSPGAGCEVTIAVPVSNVADDTSPGEPILSAPPDETHAEKSVNVMVCDDDPDMIALLEFYLHRAGYSLVISTNGREAVSKTLAYQPDIVLMDCNVPEISGIDAARELRRNGFERPILAFTASKLSDLEKSEFSAYFRKPVPIQQLLAEIKARTH
ncbi:MAG: ATP-binding protein [Pseudomonadota bacterium]